MTYRLTITVDVNESELARVDATPMDLAEGVAARLCPVVSCHPDEMVCLAVDVAVAQDGLELARVREKA